LQKSINNLLADTTLAGVAKREQLQKTLTKTEENLTNISMVKSPEAQAKLNEVSKPLNTILYLQNPNNGKIIYKYTPNKNTGEYAIIAPPGSYKLIVKTAKYPDKTSNFVIPDREPLPEPYSYNVFIK
jgi:hypothetical protein